MSVESELDTKIANQYVDVLFRWGGWAFIILVVGGIIFAAIYMWRKKNGKGQKTHVDDKAGDEGEF